MHEKPSCCSTGKNGEGKAEANHGRGKGKEAHIPSPSAKAAVAEYLVQTRIRDQRRFWGKVNITDEQSCWEWKPKPGNCGYGMFTVSLNDKKIHASSHRIAFILAYGNTRSSGKKWFVCHRCDNRRCCNPLHLFVGTHMDNMMDMMAKGRKKSRFTDSQIAAIQSDARPQPEIAKEYGISQTLVSRLQRRVRPAIRGRMHRNAKLSYDQLKALLKDNRSGSEVAATYGIRRGCVYDLRRKHRKC